MYSSTLPSLFLPASKNTAWWGLHLGETVGNGLKKDLLLLKSLLCFGWMNGCISMAPWPSIKWKCGRWRLYSHTCSCKRKESMTSETETETHGGHQIQHPLCLKYSALGICCQLLFAGCLLAGQKTVSNLIMRPSLACSWTVAAARQQRELSHPAGDSCKRTDQIALSSADVGLFEYEIRQMEFLH